MEDRFGTLKQLHIFPRGVPKKLPTVKTQLISTVEFSTTFRDDDRVMKLTGVDSGVAPGVLSTDLKSRAVTREHTERIFTDIVDIKERIFTDIVGVSRTLYQK